MPFRSSDEVMAYYAKPPHSAYGTFDQGGNLFEWNEADIFGNGLFRGLRGGSFDSFSVSLHANLRSFDFPTTENRFYGFRVAEVSGPGCSSDCDGDVDLHFYSHVPERTYPRVEHGMQPRVDGGV